MKKGFMIAFALLTGFSIGVWRVRKKTSERIAKLEEMSDKHLALFLAMNQWVKTKQEGKSIAAYLEKKGYRNIAIYGMSYIGKTLADELKSTEINVTYGIDKKADLIYADMDVDVVTMDDYLGKVDAIVVTSITFFEEIREELEKKVDCPIISFEDVLCEM